MLLNIFMSKNPHEKILFAIFETRITLSHLEDWYVSLNRTSEVLHNSSYFYFCFGYQEAQSSMTCLKTSNYIGLNFEYDHFSTYFNIFLTILNNNFNSPIISESGIYHICYLSDILYMLYIISDLFAGN